ncbi:uncharacterized protein L201_000995 [Kwoniella dendrophila CBS 6074]|uniref:Uncharacterized protein n=1 Tax=Kwoniella dendrophila CBS 6074 TaxID=1295534 RepID=A0AAX4JMZ3_9TREE
MSLRKQQDALKTHFSSETNKSIGEFSNSIPLNTYEVYTISEDGYTFIYSAYDINDNLVIQKSFKAESDLTEDFRAYENAFMRDQPKL